MAKINIEYALAEIKHVLTTTQPFGHAYQCISVDQIYIVAGDHIEQGKLLIEIWSK